MTVESDSSTEQTKVIEQESALASKPVNPEEAPKVKEVSAATVARMMGVATQTDIKLLEGKLDLLTGRLHNIGIRVEKVVTMLGNMPTGNDLERIDVQVGSLRSLIKDMLLKEMTNSDIKQAFENQTKKMESAANKSEQTDPEGS